MLSYSVTSSLIMICLSDHTDDEQRILYIVRNVCEIQIMKMLRLSTLVLLFITRIRFPPGTPFNQTITQRYGRPALDKFRSFEKLELKQLSLEADLKFLITCKQNNVIPKFIHFKTYNKKFKTQNSISLGSVNY